MEENKKTRNGILRRNYKREKSYSGPTYPFKKCGCGRFVLCLIYLIAGEKIKRGETYDRNFRKAGLTKQWLFDELVRFLPWFKREYTKGRPGYTLTPDIVYDRLHKMFYNTEKGPGKSYPVGSSWEDPRNHLALQPFLELAEHYFKRNKPISITEVIECCRELGVEFRTYGRKLGV